MSALAFRNQHVQRLRRLVAQRAAREAEQCFVLEGPTLVQEALAAGSAIDSVYVDQAAAGADGRVASLVARCREAGAAVFELETGVIERVAGTVTPQPVMAIVALPARDLDELAARAPKLVVVCVDVSDPGNVGTVARSAWASGADGLVCCAGTADIWSPKAVRASAGAVLRLPVASAGAAAQALDELASWGLHRWGTVPSGGQDYALTDLSEPSALVLGNEAAGLPLAQLGPHLDGLVSIPMAGGAESLNVAMAAAVLCFEAGRQRRSGPGAGPGGGPGKLVGNDVPGST